MNNGTFGTPYNGTGTKTWVPLGATSNTGAITVCPTADSTSAYDHYQLHYTLATPTTEIIQSEGSLNMHDGLNQVALSEGIVVRESVTPFKDGSSPPWRQINNSSLPSSMLKNRTMRILAIYKDDVLDPTWNIATSATQPTAYGKEMAWQYDSDFDPAASYSATYEVLDKYLYTTNAVSATGTYDTNDHTVLGHTVEKVSEVETRVSVVEKGKANKQSMAYFTPTFFNAWVADTPFGYYKDDMGIVRFKGGLKSGTLNTNACIMMVGFRPTQTLTFTVISNGAIGKLTIDSLGNVIPVSGSNVSFSFDGISFRAEQ